MERKEIFELFDKLEYLPSLITEPQDQTSFFVAYAKETFNYLKSFKSQDSSILNMRDQLYETLLHQDNGHRELVDISTLNRLRALKMLLVFGRMGSYDWEIPKIENFLVMVGQLPLIGEGDVGIEFPNQLGFICQKINRMELYDHWKSKKGIFK